MITGSSVIGLVYDGGVMLAADTLLSYGTLAKFQGAKRLQAIPHTSVLLGASGEYSDFGEILEILTNKAVEETRTSVMDVLYSGVVEEEAAAGEGGAAAAPAVPAMTAASTWNYLRMIMYSRRNKMNPYWNDLLVAGCDPQPFLGLVDKIGTTVQTDSFLATGFGALVALPLLREQWRPDLSEGEARALLEDCMRVLFYRDACASAQIQLAKCTPHGGVLVSDPYTLDTSWDAPDCTRPVAQLDGDGGW